MLDASIYAARRQRFMDALGPKAVAVISSLPERLRNGDADYTFRQLSDIVYLTGFVEPETTLVLRPGAETEKVVMFVRPRDPEMETWNGRRAGLEGVVATYGAEKAYATSELDATLWTLIANAEELHVSLGLDDAQDLRITHALARLRKSEKRGRRPPRSVVDLRETLHELRLRKTPDEIAVLRRAAEITSAAHVTAMQKGRPGVNEYELEAEINYAFRSRGGAGPGYNSIVGAGDNATILHYIENDQPIAAGDLVLIDAGCEVDHYTADVTRTFPASGTFSTAQRAIYELVLATEKAAIGMVRPSVTIEEIHADTIRRLTEGLVELGLLAGPAQARIDDLGYKRFYMHGTSHWLGMEVHDVGAYTRDGVPRPLEPGMVLTIEPGIYIPADASDVAEAYRGIGIRIEDDVLVTSDGHDVLTKSCPKEVADVEALCGG